MRKIVMSTLRVQGLERVIHWLSQKEIKFSDEKVMMVKCWLPELQKEENLG